MQQEQAVHLSESVGKRPDQSIKFGLSRETAEGLEPSRERAAIFIAERHVSCAVGLEVT
jgi:hypothetical protein